MTWTATETHDVWADYLRVKIGGKNVTFYRGFLTFPSSWQQTDPYGWNNATIVLPSITSFEDEDSYNDWLFEGAKVRIDAVKDGALIDPDNPVFYGIVDSADPDQNGTVVECSGSFNGRMATRMHQPPIPWRKPRDGGAWLNREVNGLTLHSGPVRLLPAGGPKTGITVGSKGSRDMTRLGYVDHVLGLLIEEDGDSWTILPAPAKGPRYFRAKKRVLKETADWTVFYGAHGVKISTRRDRVDMVKGVFGEGIAPSGERWRGAVYPRIIDAPTPDFPGQMSLGDSGDGVRVLARRLWALGALSAEDQLTFTYTDEVEDAVKDFQRRIDVTVTGVVTVSLWKKLYDDGITQRSFRQAHFEELAVDTRTEYWLRGADGTPIALNPKHDPRVVPNEIFVGYGEHTRKREARKNARGIIKRGGDRVGTVTLTSDPAEGSRFDIRPGDTLDAAYYLGLAGTKFYVSSVQVDWADSRQPVTLAVSMSAKHFLELATIKQRRMEARQDPGKHWRHQLRRSAQTSDSIVGWEGESGAGIIEPRRLIGGQWNVFPMVAADLGVIGDLRFETDVPTRWIMALFADRVFPSVLTKVLGNPHEWVGTGDDKVTTFTEHAKWLRQNERLMIEAWGEPDQRCGYWPKVEVNEKGNKTTHPVTGEHRDEGSWEFWTARGFLWWAMFPLADTTIKGRAKIQLTEGV